MINFDVYIPLSHGYAEWRNVTVDNWEQFQGFIGNGCTIRNIKRLEDI